MFVGLMASAPGNANFAWLQHMIWHLAAVSEWYCPMAPFLLSPTARGKSAKIFNADLVECIIAMPTQLFYTTQIPVSFWFIAKNKKQKGKTLFIDARKMGTMVTRKLRELTDEDIQKIVDTYNAFVDGTLEDGEPFEEKMGRLTAELLELFAKSHELENEIRKWLGAIGYEL